jgi:pyrimidine operon attenuation protein/uracil phosphoribosyltransferase
VEGIACALVDRSLLQLGIVADGIELQVPASQLEQARVVLARDYSGELEFEP